MSSGRFLDRTDRDLDAAEQRFRRCLEQRDDWRWEWHEDGSATVRNPRTGGKYRVDPAHGCNCPDAVYRRVECKHAVAYRLARLERGWL